MGEVEGEKLGEGVLGGVDVGIGVWGDEFGDEMVVGRIVRKERFGFEKYVSFFFFRVRSYGEGGVSSFLFLLEIFRILECLEMSCV